MRRLIPFLILTVFACNQPAEVTQIESVTKDTSILTVEENESTVEPEAEFLHIYSMMVKVINEKNDTEIAEFIHPKYGINLITNFNGAIPQLLNFQRYSHFDHDEQTRLKFEKVDSLLLAPKIESLPKVICDEFVFDKIGCFAQSTTNNLDQHPWNTEGEYSELIKTIKWTVVNTHNFTFYFSEIDEKYYLTFIDIRTHCSA